MTRASERRGSVSPDAHVLVLLQQPQQLALRLPRQVAHLVEEERPAARRLDVPGARPVGAGEGPRACPKSSLSISDGPITAQLTVTKARSRRGESAWMCRAR
jgi:hypothetical protein